MADFSGRSSDLTNDFGTDAESEPPPRTTGNSNKLPKQVSTHINIGTAENVAINSDLSRTTNINKAQKGPKALGIFWDIQNCPVPFRKSVLQLTSNIRNKFVTPDYAEKEFLCALDSSKESTITKEDLNNGNVTVQDVPAGNKNAADEKIKQKMRIFADSHPAGSRLVLISSDINFADDLSYIKNTKKMEVILVHKPAVNSALLLHVSEHILYTDLTDGLPDRDGHVVDTDIVLVVTGYKFSREVTREHVKEKLLDLIRQWRGTVVKCEGKFSIIRVENMKIANEVKMNLQNVTVYEQLICFKLLEESEHKDTITSMMAKNKSSGGNSETKLQTPPRKTPEDKKKTPSRQLGDISTDQEKPKLQPSLEQATSSFNIQKNTTGQYKLQRSGIFWDMETCPVPPNSTVQDVVDAIRDTCVDENYFESEFICFYDVLKSGHTLKQLEDLMITTVHTFTNAFKVIQRSLMKFAELVPPGSRLILISNNADFLHLLDHTKNVKKFQIFLIHVDINKPALDRFVSKCLTLEEIIAKDDAASADNA